uniref:Uncharacterized protein n=1 Tax=Setaria italica TaxID=4555 RepID=K4AHR6_SETIT
MDEEKAAFSPSASQLHLRHHHQLPSRSSFSPFDARNIREIFWPTTRCYSHTEAVKHAATEGPSA